MNKVTILMAAIVCIFTVGLVIMVYVTDAIQQDSSNATTATRSNIYCLNDQCGLMSYERESHVHVKGQLLMCATNGTSFAHDYITHMTMWDEDSFLTGADDNYGPCKVKGEGFFECHFVGPNLLEGISYTNAPDLYFSFSCNLTTCESFQLDDFNTLPYIVHPDFASPAHCQSSSPRLLAVETDPALTDTLHPFPYYQEVDASNLWRVWRCWLTINLDELERVARFCEENRPTASDN